MGRRTDSLGVDSLIAVEIRSWLLKTLDVSLPVLKILGGVTIRDLVDHVVKHLSPHLIPKVVAREDGPI
jgi:hybrid polyketide synthase/nonribosomal peptide synthetase ACE1